MEQNWTPAILDGFAINFVDLPGSTGKQDAWFATVSKLLASYSLKSSQDIVTVDAFQESLAVRLRSWVERDYEPSQRHFWNFYDSIREQVSTSRHRNFSVAHEFSHYILDEDRKDFISRSSRHGLEKIWPLAVIDGQRKFAAFEKANRDLSGRAIRSVLQIALDELDSFEDAETIWDVLEVLDSSLIQGIARRIRWVDQQYSFGLQGSSAPSTREWVLGFLFRTGNPPPGTGRPRPANGSAIVTIITEAWREGYATVQGQEDSRSLRDAVREQRTKTRFNRGAQNHANLDGRRQSAGRRHPRPHRSLAQCA